MYQPDDHAVTEAVISTNKQDDISPKRSIVITFLWLEIPCCSGQPRQGSGFSRELWNRSINILAALRLSLVICIDTAVANLAGALVNRVGACSRLKFRLVFA
jgi:hypothetical protein